MLATLIDAPFDDPDWLFETKWDGVRAICSVDSRRRVTMRSRNGKDLLLKYPGLAKIGKAFRSIPVVVDGEIVSLDAHGKSSFQRLQNLIESQHGMVRRGERSIKYAVFDLLSAGGRNVRREPLEERKRMLEALVVAGRGVVSPDTFSYMGRSCSPRPLARGSKELSESVVPRDTRLGVRAIG